jgi:predicted Zn-dependent protease with MMP-like domain
MPGADIAMRLDNEEFDALEDEVERLAAEASRESPARDPKLPTPAGFDPANSAEDFDALVRSALDNLPAEVLRALKDVVIVVSDSGRESRAYGLYQGFALKGQNLAAPVGRALPDQITIFRDTLVRDFGNDPELLRERVVKTVRHEVAHHLGFDESEVRRLGL